MSQLITANIGSYPRIGEEKDQQRHRRALNHLQNQEISRHAFHDVEQSVIQEVVREQILAGLDEVTDGHVSWHDPIFHFCRKVKGIQSSGLARFFDSNTYYRIPVFVHARPKKKGPLNLNDYIFAQGISNKPIRVVLTGPYTLARHSQSEVKTFAKVPARLSFFSEVILSEIESLVGQGAKYIQINEPSILKSPEDILLFKKSLLPIAEKVKPARFILGLSFAPISPLIDHLKNLPVDVLNLDFTYDGKKLLEKLYSGQTPVHIGFGLINGRNTRLEPIDSVLKIIREWIDKKNPSYCYLTPSCGLEHLPRQQAFEKLKLIDKIRHESGLTSVEASSLG